MIKRANFLHYWLTKAEGISDMAKKLKSKYAKVPVGYTHYLRSGAGPHKERKKELNKMKCRRRIELDKE